jgi:ATP/maltotriose-dependent transcriptional regulator MalT
LRELLQSELKWRDQ